MTSAMLTFASTVGASVLPATVGGKGTLPEPRLLIGGALTFAGLSMLSDFAPGIAAPLSAGIALTALTFYGVPLIDNWFNGHQNPVGKAN